MGRDTFAKFGSTEGKAPPPYNTPLPLIEGDSSDAAHYWWTELWSCGFDLTAKERPKDGEEEPDKKKDNHPNHGTVKLTKKVDWGSAALFQKCCEAPEALKKKSDEEQPVGRLKDVRIEVCRESGVESEGRFPFLIITYKSVCVTSYAIDISGPDPTETIGFQYDEFAFEYVATDPYTGGMKKKGSSKSKVMVRLEQPSSAAAQTAAAATGGVAAAGVGGVSVGVAASAVGASSSNGLPAGVASPTEAAVAANFPGYMSVIANGVLPD